MWLRHETALARTIAAETGAPPDDALCAALAHFALEAPHIARADGDGDARETITRAFDLLERGWPHAAR